MKKSLLKQEEVFNKFNSLKKTGYRNTDVLPELFMEIEGEEHQVEVMETVYIQDHGTLPGIERIIKIRRLQDDKMFSLSLEEDVLYVKSTDTEVTSPIENKLANSVMKIIDEVLTHTEDIGPIAPMIKCMIWTLSPTDEYAIQTIKAIEEKLN